MRKFAGKIEKTDIAADGSVTLLVADPTGPVEVTIPRDNAVDSLIPLLQGIARAAERPGPAYLAMLQPLGFALKLETAEGTKELLPLLLLEMEKGVFLRVLMQPSTLRPLSEQLRGMNDRLRAESKPAH